MLIDAHNHLHQAAFDGRREQAWQAAVAGGVTGAVLNGTHPDDWSAVAALTACEPAWRASYGVHPWRVADLPSDWRTQLEQRLRADAHAGVGEIGLDRWVAGHDLALQGPILAAQWQLAATLQRPVTVHVLRAWDDWMAFLRSQPESARPFLLHAFGGPPALVPELVSRGAYFSFSPSFLGAGRERRRAVFAGLPLDRLLIETDAPSMAPPIDLDTYGWTDAAGERVNHPANLLLALRGLAEVRGVPEDELAGVLAENFRTWWEG